MQIAKCKLQNEKCRGAARHFDGDPPLPPAPCPRSPHRGVTLVELLVTIMIIGVLAAMVLGVAAVAAESAREAQTRNMVMRLHSLLVQHLDTYKTRRVRLREGAGAAQGVEQAIINAIPASSQSASARRGQALAEARLYALREMMLMEIPDRWSDVLLQSVGSSDTGPPINPATAAVVVPLYLNARTELANAYLRRYLRLVGRTNTLSGSANTAGDIRSNQGAECLYMVITMACGDGEARTLFHEKNIGDSDGDGAPEFLDGWGRPINFLRWAPGFDSEIQLNANLLEDPSADWLLAAKGDHDPFDIFRAEARAFRLVPLIYSPGRNEDSGINVAPNFVTWRSLPLVANITVTNPTPASPYYLSPRLTPYIKGLPPTSPDEYMGTPLHSIDASNENTSDDNVHNHVLNRR